MSVRVRLAPSPTGNLHIGTARTGVFNWLFARHHGGTFVLRIEDTDQERSRPEYTQNILDGLTWLGLNWDEGPIFQSDRMDLYRGRVQELLDRGLAYRAYDTSEELEAMRKAQRDRHEAPRYDNRHRNLTPEQEAAFVAEGRQAVIRFKIDDDREITWNDMVRGPMTWRGSDLGGDMVIARAADAGTMGQPLYNFVVVVDDIDMAITHVIRGEDHIANTAKQILLYEALGATAPKFAHAPLILNMAGQKLSKRDGVTSISEFQAMGYTAEALANYMTLLGWSPPTPEQEIFTLPEAAQVFSFDRVNKAGAKFDWDKLNWLNSQYLHHMPVPELTDQLIPLWQSAGYTFDPVADRPWLESMTELLATGLTRLPDGVEQAKLFLVPEVTFTDDAKTQMAQPGVAEAVSAVAKKLADPTDLDHEGVQEIIKAVVKEQGVKKGLVMKSLRAALTGSLQGPDLSQSLQLLHQRGLAISRLQQAVALVQS